MFQEIVNRVKGWQKSGWTPAWQYSNAGQACFLNTRIEFFFLFYPSLTNVDLSWTRAEWVFFTPLNLDMTYSQRKPRVPFLAIPNVFENKLSRFNNRFPSWHDLI